MPSEKVLVGTEFAGSYSFTLAHYLHKESFDVVSVLPTHTKRWKGATPNRAPKTDAKEFLTAAQTSLTFPGAQRALTGEIPLIIERIEVFSA